MPAAPSLTPPTAFAPATLLSRRGGVGSSAIRDLLDQAKRRGVISLAGGLPDPALFPREQLAEIAARVTGAGDVLQYGTTQGEPATRAALTSLFDDTMIPTADIAKQMAITTGAQQSIDLVARVLIEPGDAVVVGNPDYLGALQVFRSRGAELIPVPVGADGLNTHELERLLRTGVRPKACYVVKNFHNPTGSSLSTSRRHHLAELASRYNFVLIDDDPYRDLFFERSAPDRSGFPIDLTASLRSTSKTLAPGLRVGAVVAPDWLLEPMIVAKQSCDLHTSTLSQAVVAEAVSASWYPEHLDRVRSTYAWKRDALVAAMAGTFGDRVRFSVPTGAMFLWAEVAECGDTAAWLSRALDTGVCFVPGSAFASAQSPMTKPLSSHIRLSYATGTPDQLTEGVRRLARSLQVS